MRGREKKQNSPFFGQYVGERKREERDSNFSLRSTEIGWLEFIGPRTKVHLLDEGYAWVPKRRNFTKDPKEEVSRNRIFRD